MSEEWDYNRLLKRCIIDVRDKWHDLKLIFQQLNELTCGELEIRSYRILLLDEIKEITSFIISSSIDSIVLIIPFSSVIYNETFMRSLSECIENDFRLRVTFYGVIKEVDIAVLKEYQLKYTALSLNLSFVNTLITGCDSCGQITIDNLYTMTIQQYMENKKYNGCLNRQISIDENGYIKNCPSMQKHWGHILDIKLQKVYDNPEFRFYWNLNNDQIEICNQCEFRRICLGCRAYLSDPQNIYSKPKKCTYNPLK